ncbi:MAG TPA: argininosuccinate synthase domain-containing protein [Vicinamibacterales bacterium]|nr:argininosuccinate synthase domain-containing protein [Vicinamibacterales bacterium]
MKPIVVLAYSGGARSNAAIPWLADRHRAEVVTVTLDLGQSGDMNEIRTQALSAGAARAHVIDARDEFARDIVLPSLKAGALSDTRYPMATALTRPVIAKTLVSIAAIEDAAQVAHGAIGRDRRRLAQPISTLNPTLKEIACAEEMGFVATAGEAAPANRIDDNLWGRTIGRRGDDGSREADESLFKITRRLDEAPVKPAHVEIEFERGAAVGINGVTMRLGELIESLKTIAGEHGVGRLDRIKVKPDGTRSRAFYEAPAAVVLHLAHAELWRYVSSESQQRFDTAVSAAYVEAIDRGEWFDPLRTGLDAYVNATSEQMTGTIRVRLLKGGAQVVGRKTQHV